MSTHEEEKKEEKKEDTKCANGSCEPINRIIAALNFCDLVNDQQDVNEYIIDYFQKYQNLLNDYHHILKNHLNHPNPHTNARQFRLIHNNLAKFNQCSIKNCQRFQRNQNNYESNNINHYIDIKLAFYVDTLDNIHCYFQHSYDVGYRLNDDVYDEDQKLNDTNTHNLTQQKTVEYKDNNIRKINHRITQQSRLKNNISSCRYKRFGDSLRDAPSSIICDDKCPVITHYELGNRCYFGSENKTNDIENIKKKKNKKYQSLKDEILNNKICALPPNHFKISLNKAETYKKSNVIKAMKSSNDFLCRKYNIKENEAISFNHIICILLYCDYQKLHDGLRQTFKMQNNNKIHEYWNFCRYLIEAVECFGNSLEIGNKFYYYLVTESCELNKYYFSNFSLKFCSPTSITCQLPVAVCSANKMKNENGFLLELNKHCSDFLGDLKYIDCCFFSYHSNENEKLFFGGLYPLKICNMTNIKTHQSYKLFIRALTTFDDAINGRMSEDINKNDLYIVNNLWREKTCVLPLYIKNIFKSFCKQKKEIIIDINIFNTDAISLYDCFFSDEIHEKIISITKIAKLFTECISINIMHNIDISSLYLTQLLIELTADNEYISTKSALKEILFVNVKLDQDLIDKIFQRHQTEFESKQYELISVVNNKGNYDITIKIKDLRECNEYQDIRKYVQDELSKLLLRTVSSPHNKHGKEYEEIAETQQYKTSNDLLTEISNCIAAEANCDVYTNCESIKRIKIVLTAYKKLMSCSKLWKKVSLLEILSFDNIYGLTQINDDFMHIQLHIDENNNKDSEPELHRKFKNEFECIDNDKCHRNNRGRRSKFIYPTSMDLEDRTFQETCDKIHSFMIHFEYFDETVERLSQSSNSSNEQQHTKQKKKKVYAGKKEDERWWNFKMNECKQDDINLGMDDEIDAKENEDIYRNLIANMNIFRWQQPHGFTTEQHEGLMHLKAKYKSVKEEALHNPYYSLSTDNWNQTLRKSTVFFNSFARHRIKTLYPGTYDDKITGSYEEWQRGVDIDMKEIVTLKLYTDFDKLQYELKKCFRFDTLSNIFTLMDFNPKLSKEEAMKNQYDAQEKDKRFKLEQRLCAFYWWRIKLLTVLNKYGKKLLDQKIPLFHGVNAKMILNNGRRQNLTFYGPLSSSASYHVARTFATAKGMVLQVGTQYPRLHMCRAFDASLISDYPEEKEWLIGFIYLRIIKVLTRPLNKFWKKFEDIDDKNKYYPIPLSSQTRSIFFAIHLFRQQIFSMSVHSEYYLTAFLYLQCNFNADEENKDNGHIKRTNFIEQLEKVVGNNRSRNKNKQNDEKRHHKILNILWNKFDNFRKYPNSKQVVKMDTISENLKHYFMDFNGFDIRKKEKYIISFSKIIRIFQNVQEIHFINSYLLDDIVLLKLIAYLDKHRQCKLNKIKMLYYDYDTPRHIHQNNQKNKYMYYPMNSQIFKDPDTLDKRLLIRLGQKGWEVKHKKIGNTGYQIQIFLRT